MDPRIVLPALTSILALVFAVALFDQWRERRGTFQLVWTFGMLFYGIASACEAIGRASGWNEALYRTWYLTGAVWTAGWLGLGTAFLLGRTRFGYSFAFSLFFAGMFTFFLRNSPQYQGAGTLPLLYFIAAGSWLSRSRSRPTSRTNDGRGSPWGRCWGRRSCRSCSWRRRPWPRRASSSIPRPACPWRRCSRRNFDSSRPS